MLTVALLVKARSSKQAKHLSTRTKSTAEGYNGMVLSQEGWILAHATTWINTENIIQTCKATRVTPLTNNIQNRQDTE